MPTYGDLIDLFEVVQEQNFNDEHVLCEKFREKFPHVEIRRPRRFFDVVQRIVAAAKRSMTGSIAVHDISTYRERVWVPRVRNVPTGK